MTTIIVTKSSGRLGLTCENHPKRKGALVVGLVEASTAAAAGLRVGDLIVSVNHYLTTCTQWPLTSKECISAVCADMRALELVRGVHALVAVEVCVVGRAGDVDGCGALERC